MPLFPIFAQKNEKFKVCSQNRNIKNVSDVPFCSRCLAQCCGMLCGVTRCDTSVARLLCPLSVQSCGFACLARDIGTRAPWYGVFCLHYFELRCFNNGIRVAERKMGYFCALYCLPLYRSAADLAPLISHRTAVLMPRRRPFARLPANRAARVCRPTARIRMRGTRGRTARRSPSGVCASRGSPKRRPPPRLPPPPRGNIRPPDR